MVRTRQAAVSPEIKAVGARIAGWRRSRRNLGPMPAELWDAAISLAKEHGVGPVARGLGVDYGGLRRRMDERGGAEATGAESQGLASFVELPTATPPPEGAVPGVELELRDPDGSRLVLRVPGSEAPDVGAVVSAFRGRGR